MKALRQTFVAPVVAWECGGCARVLVQTAPAGTNAADDDQLRPGGAQLASVAARFLEWAARPGAVVVEHPPTQTARDRAAVAGTPVARWGRLDVTCPRCCRTHRLSGERALSTWLDAAGSPSVGTVL